MHNRISQGLSFSGLASLKAIISSRLIRTLSTSLTRFRRRSNYVLIFWETLILDTFSVEGELEERRRKTPPVEASFAENSIIRRSFREVIEPVVIELSNGQQSYLNTETCYFSLSLASDTISVSLQFTGPRAVSSCNCSNAMRGKPLNKRKIGFGETDNCNGMTTRFSALHQRWAMVSLWYAGNISPDCSWTWNKCN